MTQKRTHSTRRPMVAISKPWRRYMPGAMRLVVVAALAGCGQRDTAPQNSPTQVAQASPAQPLRVQPSLAQPLPVQPPRAQPPTTPPPLAQRPPTLAQAQPDESKPRLGEPQPPNQRYAPREIDANRAKAAGIRKVQGKHLWLYTDLPPSNEVDGLVDVFDQSYEKWCDYFDRPELRDRVWQMNGFLMKDKATFEATGLLPDDLPKFSHGFALGADVWLFEQPNDYYRRHLLLHEATHGFMNMMLGGCGPPWFMEGLAERLATHRLDDGQLTLAYFPRHSSEVPLLGRIRLVNDAVAAGRILSVSDILAYSPRAHVENEPYAWCWALTTFLDLHPRYHQRFRQLAKDVLQPDFNRQFTKRFADDWRQLGYEWLLFATTLQHGHDVKRTAIDFVPGKPLEGKQKKIAIAADRGWQSSGIRLQSGVTYHLRASGRYQVAREPTIWWCEPGGVSIRYYGGRPLGILLAAVHAEEEDDFSAASMFDPLVVGLETLFTPSTAGTLYLRINDSPAELADNAGTLEVDVRVRDQD